MITLINTLPEIQRDSAVLARIKCTFCAYGKYPEIALFWEQKNENGELLSLISLFDSNLTVWAKSADSELKNFISVLSAKSIYAEADIAKTLGIKGEKLCAVMRISHSGGAQKQICTDRLYEIFKDDFSLNKNEFIADVSHRLRHSSAKCVVGEKCAAFMQTGDGVGYITGITVDGGNRRKGQGSGLLKELLSLPEREMPIYACCSEQVLPFYLKNGFSKITPCVIGSM